MKKTFTYLLSLVILLSFQNHLLAQGGNALDFDGVDDVVSISSITGSLHTIEFYINSNSSLDGTGTTSLLLNFNSNSQWVGLNSLTGALTDETISISSGGGNYSATDTDIPNGWHHVAIVSDGATYNQIYIDGVAANMIATSAAVFSNTNLDIGSRLTGGSGLPFGGQLEEVRIWNVSRTPAEILSTLNMELSGSETSLAAYYNFNLGTAGGDNGSGCPVAPCIVSLTDVTGNGFTGTLSGFSLSGINSNWVASNAPLPVEFLSFKALNTVNGISLDWETTQEINNSGFEVQTSSDLNNWEALGFVAGKGAVTEINSYNFLHTSPRKGQNYYRLKQIDINGAFDFSELVSVYSSGLGILNIYPNPSQSLLNIDGIDVENVRYRILDNTGRTVIKSELDSNQIDISTLANGLYFLSLDLPGENIVQRIVKY
ncbi:MAG: LamG-like jellyroll fold domain-containing protein [Bacteroidota bacterium]